MQVDVTNSSAKQIRKLTKPLRFKISQKIKTLESLANISEVKSEKLAVTKDRYKITSR